MELPPFSQFSTINTPTPARPSIAARTEQQSSENNQNSSPTQRAQDQREVANPSEQGLELRRASPASVVNDQVDARQEPADLLDESTNATVTDQTISVDSQAINITAVTLSTTRRAIAQEEDTFSSQEASPLVIEQRNSVATRTFLSVASPQNEFRLIDLYV